MDSECIRLFIFSKSEDSAFKYIDYNIQKHNKNNVLNCSKNLLKINKNNLL